MTELWPPHYKTLIDEDLLIGHEQRKWFLAMESTPGVDTVNIVEITTKGFEQYINFIDKAVAGFEKTDSNSERSSVGKCYQCCICDRRSQSMWQTTSFSYFKRLPKPPNHQQPPP